MRTCVMQTLINALGGKMNTEFEAGNRRFVPGKPVTYNGTPGRFWTAYTRHSNCWVRTRNYFFANRTTKREIIETAGES